MGFLIYECSVAACSVQHGSVQQAVCSVAACSVQRYSVQRGSLAVLQHAQRCDAALQRCTVPGCSVPAMQ